MGSGIAMALDTITGNSAMAARITSAWGKFPPLDAGGVPAPSPPWFVAVVTPGRERKAAESLEALGFGTFMPVTIAERIRRRYRWGRWYEEVKRKPVLAFPTYLFVSFDPADPSWRHIPRLDHVRSLMGPDAERPQPVKPSAMAHLMQAAAGQLLGDQQAEDLIRAGVLVEVVNGPFANARGVCTLASGKRVVLSLSVFGRESPIELRPEDVRRVED